MARSDATTVDDYLAKLPPKRHAALAKVRNVILANLPEGFEEAMQYGMISYVSRSNGTRPPTTVGRSRWPRLRARRTMSLYPMGIYGGRDTWFREEYAKTGKQLDMGKACVRFRSIDDLPLDLVGRTISMVSVKDLILTHEAARSRWHGRRERRS